MSFFDPRPSMIVVLSFSTTTFLARPSICNGHITVHSEVGHGTTFRLYLPRSDGVEEEVAVRQSAALPRGSERILMVEDEPQVRAGIVNQLQSLGYSVSEADHGQAAIASFEVAHSPSYSYPDRSSPRQSEAFP